LEARFPSAGGAVNTYFYKEVVMQRIFIVFLGIALLVFNIKSFAQESQSRLEELDLKNAEDFVRNSKTVPDVNDAGWLLMGEESYGLAFESGADRVTIPISVTVYFNVNTHLSVKLFIVSDKEGIFQVYGMSYGTGSTYRYAINADLKWNIAKETYTEENKNSIYPSGINYDDKLGLIAITMALDTDEGIKEVVVKVRDREETETLEEKREGRVELAA
jgi:hypothetical protein